MATLSKSQISALRSLSAEAVAMLPAKLQAARLAALANDGPAVKSPGSIWSKPARKTDLTGYQTIAFVVNGSTVTVAPVDFSRVCSFLVSIGLTIPPNVLTVVAAAREHNGAVKAAVSATDAAAALAALADDETGTE